MNDSNFPTRRAITAPYYTYPTPAAQPAMASLRFAKANADGSAFAAELTVPANSAAALLLVALVVAACVVIAVS
jgi:hypothetical protein